MCAQESSLTELVITPACTQSQTAKSLGRMAKLALVWRACRNSLDKSESSGTQVNSVTTDKRQELLGAFQKRYNSHHDIFHQPSDATLALLIKLQHRRADDFLPLSRVANLEEGRDIRADTSSRTKFGEELTLVLETHGQSEKASDYSASSEAFCRAVRILLFWICPC